MAVLIQSIDKENDIWYAVADLGRIKITFVPDNKFGIIDHWVTFTDGTTVYHPMRVTENDEGSEFALRYLRCLIGRKKYLKRMYWR